MWEALWQARTQMNIYIRRRVAYPEPVLVNVNICKYVSGAAAYIQEEG